MQKLGKDHFLLVENIRNWITINLFLTNQEHGERRMKNFTNKESKSMTL